MEHDKVVDVLQEVLTHEYEKYKDARHTEQEVLFFAGILHAFREVANALDIKLTINNQEVK
jgi:hypothetical protein